MGEALQSSPKAPDKKLRNHFLSEAKQNATALKKWDAAFYFRAPEWCPKREGASMEKAGQPRSQPVIIAFKCEVRVGSVVIM